MFESALITGIVAAAALFLAWRAWALLRGPGQNGVCGCSGCPVEKRQDHS